MKFELIDDVEMSGTGKTGIVIGRSEYAWDESVYLVRGMGDNGYFDVWCKESELSPVTEKYPHFEY